MVASKTNRKSGKALGKKITKALKNYPDTQGIELSEPVTKNEAKQAKIDRKEIQKRTSKQAVPAKTDHLFKGTIPATKVLRRRMPEFLNCIAFAWCIINAERNTVTYANSYGQKVDETVPRASYDPGTYTYPIKEKVIAKKLEQYEEVEDRAEWPKWISVASKGKKTSK